MSIRLVENIEAETNKKISKVSARLYVSDIAGYKVNSAARFDIVNRYSADIYVNPVPFHVY